MSAYFDRLRDKIEAVQTILRAESRCVVENPSGMALITFKRMLGDGVVPYSMPVDVLMAATEPGPHGKLDEIELQWDRRTALGVVLAAPGYPLNPRKGDAITGIPADSEDAAVFHAGTTLADGTLRTSGGRVLCVTVLADSVRQAQQRAYQVTQGIHFDGMQYRTDIGYRAIKA